MRHGACRLRLWDYHASRERSSARKRQNPCQDGRTVPSGKMGRSWDIRCDPTEGGRAKAARPCGEDAGLGRDLASCEEYYKVQR